MPSQPGSRAVNAAADNSGRAAQGSTLPFLLSKEQKQAADQRARVMFTTGILPPAIRQSNIRWWITQPSYLKSHDWQLMAGALGAYLLHGFLGREQGKAVFALLQLFHRLISKQIQWSQMPTLATEAVAVVAQLECVLPACENGILQHLLIHIAERAATVGPLWVHAMSAWERM